MKKLLVLMVLISTSLLSAKAFDEKPADQQISVKHLVGLEFSINMLKNQVSDLQNTDFSPEEGKIVAAQLMMVQMEIMTAEELLMAIEDDTSLTMGNINTVKRKIKSAQYLLEEI